MWRFKLRLPAPLAGAVIAVAPDAPASELLAAVGRAANSTSGVKVLCGFPPAALLISDDSAPVSALPQLRNGDTLTVVLLPAAPPPSSPAGAPQQQPDSGHVTAPAPAAAAAAAVATGRPSRATKTAAAGHIASAIADDARLVAAHKKKAAPRASSMPQASPRAGGGGSGSGSGAAPPASAKRARGAYFSRLGGAATGRTLLGTSPGDCAAAAAPPASALAPGGLAPAQLRFRRAPGAGGPAAKRRRVSLSNSAAATGVGVTLEERLAAAVSGAAASDPTTDFLRAAAQLALAKQYEVTRAEGRVRAALSGQYELAPVPTSRTLAGGYAQLRVRYRPSGTARGRVEEDIIDNLPALAVVTILRQIAKPAAPPAAAAPEPAGGCAPASPDEAAGAARELLKPNLLAQVSPRQFWALVRFGGAVLAVRDAATAAAAAASSASAVSSAARQPPLADNALLLAAKTAGAFEPDASVAWGARRTDPEACLRVLVPDANWSFLAERARRLSEKALASAAQAAAEAADREARRRRRLGLPQAALAAPVDVEGEGVGHAGDSSPTSGACAAGAAAASSLAPAAASAGPVPSAAPSLGPSKLVLEHLLLARAAAASTLTLVTAQSLHAAARDCAAMLTPQPAAALQGREGELAAIQVFRVTLARLARLLKLEGGSSSSSSSSSSGSSVSALDWLHLGQAPAVPSPQLEALLSAAASMDAEALLASASTLRIATALVPPRQQHDDGAEAEQREFICDACGKVRELCSSEVDLDAVEASPSWTCAGGGNAGLVAASLAARGGCAAPSDDLVRLLGCELAAAACDAMGLTSPLALAAARIPDDDDVLYCGPEGALPTSYAHANALAQLAGALGVAVGDGGAPEQAGVTWAARLSQRLASTPLVTARLLGPGAFVDEPPAPPAGSSAGAPAASAAAASAAPTAAAADPRLLHDFAPVRLENAHAGHKLVHAAALQLLLAADDSPGGDAAASAATALALQGLLQPTGAPPQQPPSIGGALAAAASHQQLAAAASALLRTPVGWVACAALARAWQRFTRYDVLDEWWTALLLARASDAAASAGGDGDDDGALDAQTGLPALPQAVLDDPEEYAGREAVTSRVKEVLERLRLLAPLELARTPAQVLLRLLQDEGLAPSAAAEMGGGDSQELPSASSLLSSSSSPMRDAAVSSRGSGEQSAREQHVTMADVQLWLAHCRRLLVAQPWLQDVAIA